jgi:predicted CopG family antitoxin
MREMTTMQISKETLSKLDKLKVHEREPYEDVIKRLLKEREAKK